MPEHEQERKEWLRATHSPSGTLATVTLQQGNVTVKWSAKSWVNGLKGGIKEARAGAEKALEQLLEAADERSGDAA